MEEPPCANQAFKDTPPEGRPTGISQAEFIFLTLKEVFGGRG